MRVVNIRGVEVDALVGPEHGAGRIFIWCVTVQAGEVIGIHHHNGEELIRVLYGNLRMRVGDQQREVGAGQVVIIPPETWHGYRALEDTEIEVYGEIGMGEFLSVIDAEGNEIIEEIFVQGSPWSRTPDSAAQYINHEQLLAKYRDVEARNPI